MTTIERVAAPVSTSGTLPRGWERVPLGKVLTQYTEYVESPDAREYPKLSVKLYGRGVVMDTPADGASLRMQRHQLAKAGQVILSEIWGKKGAIGIVPPDGDGALCTSHFFLFDIQHDRMDPRWLQAIFSANYLQAQLDSEAHGTTGYAAVRPRHLFAAEIPLPPLDEQRRIVARIEALAARIAEARELRREAAELADALIRSTMREAFATDQERHASTLEAACNAIIDNLHSNPVYAESGIPCVRSPDVGWGTLDMDRALRTTEEEYRRRTVRGEPKPGDIVLVREGGGTGKAALVEEGRRFSLGQRVMMIRPNCDVIMPKYFLYQLLSPAVYDEQIAPMSKGSASPHLNIGALRKFRFHLPPISKQKRVVARLDELFTWKRELERHQVDVAAELEALLPAVLDRAFRGEL